MGKVGRPKSQIPNYVAKTFFCVLHSKALENMGITPNWENIAELKANLNEALNLISTNYVYTICKSEKGVYHIHLVITVDKATRATTLSKNIGNAHIEPMRGTKEQADDYINKRGKFEEKGEIILDKDGNIETIVNNQGARTDWIEFDKLALKDGFNLNDYILEKGYTGYKEKACITRYSRLIEQKTQCFRSVEVIYVEGDTGQGKTKGVYDRHPYKEVFKFSTDTNNNFKFDGYKGEKILLLDELRPNQLSTGYLFQLLDGYPLRVNVKGGYMWAQWNKVYITTSYSLSEWFKVDKSKPYFDTEEKCESVEKLRKQFIRRISAHYKAINFVWTPIPLNSSDSDNIPHKEEFMQVDFSQIPFID